MESKKTREGTARSIHKKHQTFKPKGKLGEHHGREENDTVITKKNEKE